MADTALDFRDRASSFAALESGEFDLLVIGAGITGTGVARDAALRGMRVAIVDARDIAAGTSSRSSKLVHGGMRYLSEGHVRIVREAARERTVLRRIAPHLAQTTHFFLAVRSRTTLYKFKAGMVAYEKLGKVVPSERHQVWDVARVKAEEPHLVSEGLTGAIVYPEYQTDDARLTLGNARSAAEAGAVVVTYAAVEEILVENGKACGAIVRDTLHGGEHGARIRARMIVNATGPWLDAVRKLEDGATPDKLQLTKGIHVVVTRERLPIHHTIIMRSRDKRSNFAVPCGRFVYLGTTDTFYPKTEYWPEITRDDVDYLLEPASHRFKGDPLTYDDVVSAWSGLRPLLAQKGKGPSEISRKNEILCGPAGVLSIAGGKLTSFRSVAERVVDVCETRMERKATPCRTADEALPGGDIAAGLETLQAAIERGGLGAAEAERAARLYGAEAEDVFSKGSGPAIEAEYAVLKEGALTLEDYWYRRSARARFDDEGGVAALEPAAESMARLLGWSDTERRRQVDACRAVRGQEMQFAGLEQGAHID